MVAEAILLGAAGNLAYVLLEKGTKSLSGRKFTKGEESALQRVYAHAFAGLLRYSKIRLVDQASVNLQHEILKRFVGDTKVSQMLLSLVLDDEDLTVSSLRDRFVELGGSIEWFPESFDSAMVVFLDALTIALHQEAELPGSPLFNRVTSVRLRKVQHDVAQLAALVDRAGPSSMVLRHSIDVDDLRGSPYKGLEAFDEDDERFFRGRGKATDRLVQLLRPVPHPRFIAILGPSGSGKSSLVHAGLVPRLRKGARQGGIPGSDRWQIVTMRPADELGSRAGAEASTSQSRELLRQLYEQCSSMNDGQRLLLIVDQLEEIFAGYPVYLRDEFIQGLSHALSGPLDSQPITIVIVMRDDFYSTFMVQATPLVPWLEQGLFNIPQVLDRGDLEEIVRLPAEQMGISFDPGLVELLVNEAISASPTSHHGAYGAQVTILPLLEFALNELWSRREGSNLSHNGYQAIKGVSGALPRWADSVFQVLPSDQQGLARRIITDLVHVGNEDRMPDSRRRRHLQELLRQESDDGEEREVQQVVRKLADARLVIASRDEVTGLPTVELIHESLLREWQTLRQWLEESRPLKVWRQQSERRIQEWIASNRADPALRDDDWLLGGHELVEAERWLSNLPMDLSHSEREFIGASVAKRDREREQRENYTSLEREVGDLKEALEIRKVIERAKGLLMRNYGLSEDDAFRQMRRTAMNTRRPLREIADAVVMTIAMELMPGPGLSSGSPPDEFAPWEVRDLQNSPDVDVLVRAKGLLMRNYGLSEDDAHRRIRSAAMTTRKPMRVVAEAVILAMSAANLVMT